MMKHQWKQKQQPSGRITVADKKEGAIREPYSHYEDDKVRFSLRHCDTGRYCIRHTEKQEIERLYKTLGHFEQLTWKQFDQLRGEDGAKIEIEGSASCIMLKNKYPSLQKFCHMRVSGTPKPFRVFAARDNTLFYILLFDKDGSIHH